MAKLKRLLVIAAIAIVFTVGSVTWFKTRNEAVLPPPPPPKWEHIEDDESARTESIATGLRNGKEVVAIDSGFRVEKGGWEWWIIYFDVDTGTRLWEVRRDEYWQMSVNPELAIDSSGNVLVGWGTFNGPPAPWKAVSKYSQKDGNELWNWEVASLESSGTFTVVPYTDSADHVWVSFIKEIAGTRDSYRKYLALLDSNSGEQQWLIELGEAKSAHDFAATVYPLKDGNAVVVTPPSRSEKPSPLKVAKVSATNGDILWEKQFPPDYSEHVIDDAGQLIYMIRFEQSVPRGIALDIKTGNEVWSVSPLVSNRIRGFSVNDHGDLVVWATDNLSTSATNWFRWKNDEGFFYPTSNLKSKIRPTAYTYSRVDGTLVEQRQLSDRNEAVHHVLHEHGSGKAGIVFLTDYTIIPIESFDPQTDAGPAWRAIVVGPDGTPGKTIAGGPEAYHNFYPPAAATPWGSLIIGGSLAAEREHWMLRLWEKPSP